MGGNQDIHVTDAALRLQTIYLKEKEAERLVLHFVYLCKPHGYALELYPGGEALGKLSVHEVEDEPASRMAESGSGRADRGRHVVLEGMTLDKLAALAKYRSLQLMISLELDYILSGTLRAQKPGPDGNARALAPLYRPFKPTRRYNSSTILPSRGAGPLKYFLT